MLGRILNRFSKDIGLIDEILPNVLVDVIQVKYNNIGFIFEYYKYLYFSLHFIRLV